MARMSNAISTDDVKYSTSDEDIAPLTTVIGIKSVDGIVLASDSQYSTGFTKDLCGSKIFKINRFTALGSSGQVR